MDHKDPKWKLMRSAPKNGTYIDVKCVTPSGREIVIKRLCYGRFGMGQQMILQGRTNVLSPYFTPIGWTKSPPEAPRPIAKKPEPVEPELVPVRDYILKRTYDTNPNKPESWRLVNKILDAIEPLWRPDAKPKS